LIQEKLDCEKCGKIFTRSKDLKFHIKGCQQCVCEECGQNFTHALQLKRHNLKKHSNVANHLVTNTIWIDIAVFTILVLSLVKCATLRSKQEAILLGI
jgi:uncharacterized C2H2 Zn-finger protein